MAKIFLDSGETFGGTVGSNSAVYGSGGSESFTLAAGATGVTVDQSVEDVVLAGATTAYTYQQQGNQLVVYSGANEVLRTTLQTDANGTVLQFANGAVDVVLVTSDTAPPTVTLGGTTVTAGTTAADATAVTPVTIDTTTAVLPVVTAGQAFSINENSAADAPVGQVVATDAASTISSYAITSGNDAGYFTINAAGNITVTAAGAAANALDAEGTTTSFTLGVKATDARGVESAPASVTIGVSDVNDNTPVLTAPAAITVAEAGAAVTGQLVATDADVTASTRTYTLVTPVEGLTLDTATGAYTFDPAANAAANALAYNSANLPLSTTFTVSDGVNTSAEQTLNITVTPKPLTYTITADKTSAEEGATTVYTVTASEALATPVDVVFTLQPGEGTAVDTGTTTTNTADFATGAFNPTTVTIAAGSDSAAFNVVAVNDAKTELQESYSVKAEVDGLADPLTLSGKVVDATGAGGVGQTFTLTTSIDTVGGASANLKGSANSYGTDGNDTIVATDLTLGGLDSIDAGLGTNTLRFDDTTGAAVIAPTTIIQNVQTINVRSVGDVGVTGAGKAFSTANLAGVETLNVTLGADVFAEAAATTNINVSGATKAITIDGGKNITVTDATADQNIAIGGGTVNAGTITVTDTKQGTGTIAIDGGTDVTVTATAEITAGGTSGAITVGDTGNANTKADMPTGAIKVTQNLNSDGANALTGGAISAEGGTTVDVNVNATSNAKTSASNAAITIGQINVTGYDNTTTVTVNQNKSITTTSSAAVGGVTETASVKFGALKSGDALTISVNNDATADAAELKFTASKDLTAAEVAAAFANLTNLDTQSSGGKVANGVYSGALSLWTSGAASGDTVVFTSTTANNVATNLQVVLTDNGTAGDSTAAVVTTTEGAVVTTPAATSSNAVNYGKVVIADGGTDSITTVTVDGYAANSTIASNKLATLSLANSAGAIAVTSAATTQALTVNNVDHGVTLDAALTDLTLTATGAKASVFSLTATGVKNLVVNANDTMTLTGSTIGTATALTTVDINGTGAVTLPAVASTGLKSFNAADNTGGVTATVTAATVGVHADFTKYTFSQGADTVTLSATAVDKNIELGDGNDKITLATGTTALTGTIDGGTGTNTLVMAAADAATASATATFEGKISNFQKLSLGALSANATIDLANLDDISYVIGGSAGSTLTLTHMANAGTLDAGAGTGTTVVTMTDAASNTDSFNVKVNAAAGTVDVAGVETINVTAAAAGSVTLKDAALTTVNIDGAATLGLTLDPASTAVTLVDATNASGALTFGASLNNLVVNGGTGKDALTAAANDVALHGGTGDDTLTVASGLRVNLYGDAGKDTFVINTTASATLDAYTVINGVASGDVIKLGDATKFSSTKIALSVGADETLLNYANQACKSLAENEMGWFQKGDNTYIVLDQTVGAANAGGAADTFDNSTDQIIMITGLVDLGTGASFNTSNILEII